MPLSFNLSPYNDDFVDTKHFYRVLYKPAVAVQARELTTMQSILQQQIKNLGDSIYQQGSMVIPGNIATDPQTAYVILNPTYGFVMSTPIPVNLPLFTGQIIVGQTTGLQAQVVYSTPAVNSDNPTLFVKYLNTGTNGAEVFAGGETLTILNSNVGLATVQASNGTGLCISAQISEGVYYVWGFFVRVEQQYLLLNKYSNLVSCRVGLEIVETIVTSASDPSLLDNAQGSTNYAAPGADRYKIDLILTSKPVNDTTQDNNFIELVRLLNSITQTQVATDTYSVVLKEMATRMADANGDFAVRNFAINIKESLDTSFVTTDQIVSATPAVGPTPGPAAPATVVLATSASATDGIYVNDQLYISNGSGSGQNFTITGYTGASKTAVLSDDFLPNKVPDTTSTYIISNPTQVNNGVYPPPPFGIGDASQLAVGLESGYAYVDGYRINTLSTTYVTVDKARTTAQAVANQIQTPIGNYIYVMNISNFPLASASAQKNFLTINFSNQRASGSFDLSTNGMGTAKVHAVEYFSGSGAPNAGDPAAVFKLYIFDINMNAGLDIDDARSFYLVNDLTYNNNGDSLDAWGDICTMFDVTNINGMGLVAGATITGPSGIGTETLVYFDPINNIIVTQCNSTNATQILTNGTFTAPSATTGTLANRRQIFNTQLAMLIYQNPNQLISTVRASDNSCRTNYYVRTMFEATRNTSGQYIFTTSSSATFAPYNSTDYLATVVYSPVSGEIGNIVDLDAYINDGSFGGSPANTSLTFSIVTSGQLGFQPGTIIKLMATLYKTAALEKSKVLTSTTIAYPNPTAIMTLGKADVYNFTHVYDSGDPGVDATTSDMDISGRYVLDTGQRDAYYDVGALYLSPNAPAPAGRILIAFQYFAASGSGDYFSVDSYTNQVPYVAIPTYTAQNGTFMVLRDCFDFRPRIEDDGLAFSGTGGSYSAPLQTSNSIIADYQYYLGRIDKIYLDQYGNFNDITGTPAIAPQPPPDPLDGMMLYTITLNPYTLSNTDVSIVPTKNPRYTMHDIGNLEARIANLEYYVSLNQLESNTANYTVTNTATGLDRYQNGFVVDNFSGMSVANVFDPGLACSIDPTTSTMRPTFIQGSIALNFNPTASSGYVIRDNIVILPYTQIVSITQTFATDTINVNPFAVFTYYGDVNLIPPTDTWIDTIQRPVINLTDDSALDGYQYVNQWSGVQWGSWQTTWVGVPVSTTSTSVTSNTVSTPTTGGGSTDPQTIIQNIIAADPNTWVYNQADGYGGTVIQINGNPYCTGPEYNGQNSVQVPVTVNGPGATNTTTTTTAVTVSTTQQIGQTRTGIQTMTTVGITQQVNNSIVDVSLAPFIRSRRIKVVGLHMKPTTQMYPFFDGVSVSAFCRPYQDPLITPTITDPSWAEMTITWGGDYSPQDNVDEGVSEDTTDTDQTATYLVGALADPIITDATGSCTLFFEIPCNVANEFNVGARVFRLTSSSTNAMTASAYGDATYTASGIIDQNQETITSIAAPQVITQQVSQSQVITENLGSTTTTSSQTSVSQTAGTPTTVDLTLWVDPLAQSFLVKCNGGIFLTAVDIYFATADASVPIEMQIRTMVNGYPSQVVVPYSAKTLYPGNPNLSTVNSSGVQDVTPPYTNAVINVSADASVATQFVFDSPVYLQDGTEYAIVLIANSINYTVYTAIIGNTIIGSTSIVSTPPYLGSIFKSQNASTWVADPTQNMKFTCYQAQFDPTLSGEIYWTNASVQPDTLGNLPFQTASGLNLVRVSQPNHGMPQGENVNSVVEISNIAPGTYNGLTDVQLTGTFSITNVTLDDYCITVPGTAAVGTGLVGPEGVVASANMQYDTLCIVANTLTVTGTSVDFAFVGITGKSPDNNMYVGQEPYEQDTSWVPIPVNVTNGFLDPRMIASDINETTDIPPSGLTGNQKSFNLQATLSTTTANLTPQVDLGRMSLIMANTRLDDPTFANRTIQAMDAGPTVTSNSTDYLTFDSQVIVQVIAVTGGQFLVNDTVVGQTSGAQGTVVAWDSVNLTLSAVTGIFVVGEAITDSNDMSGPAIGTVQNFEYINTITNPDSVLDFSIFLPGYLMEIDGCASNPYPFSSPVLILGVDGNQITCSTGVNPPFVYCTNQANVTLIQYNRFVFETGPNRCTTAARYITRQFNLANPADTLNILFTVMRPPGSFIDCYYRVLPTNSTAVFDTILWTPIGVDDTVDSNFSTSPSDYKDYSYSANDIGAFTAFSVKLVMRGGNSSEPPLVQGFRAIALNS